MKSWIGATDCYGNTANAVVVKDEYGIHADIQDFLNGRSYRVFSKDGVVSVYECDPNYVEKTCGTELIELGEQSSEEYCESSENSMLPDELSMLSASSASETYVDTLLVFDTAAQSWLSKQGTTMDSFAAVAVAKMNTACAGGSSKVFKSALNALGDNMCTSSMI